MHWTTYRHIPGDTPEKPARPQARQANSSPDAACSTLQDDIGSPRFYAPPWWTASMLCPSGSSTNAP
jgi:hypothetical protein